MTSPSSPPSSSSCISSVKKLYYTIDKFLWGNKTRILIRLAVMALYYLISAVVAILTYYSKFQLKGNLEYTQESTYNLTQLIKPGCCHHDSDYLYGLGNACVSESSPLIVHLFAHDRHLLGMDVQIFGWISSGLFWLLFIDVLYTDHVLDNYEPSDDDSPTTKTVIGLKSQVFLLSVAVMIPLFAVTLVLLPSTSTNIDLYRQCGVGPLYHDALLMDGVVTQLEISLVVGSLSIIEFVLRFAVFILCLLVILIHSLLYQCGCVEKYQTWAHYRDVWLYPIVEPLVAQFVKLNRNDVANHV